MGNKGIRYAIRDGFVGLKRHPMILLVSITTMFILLVLLGSYVVFALNANAIVKDAGEIPPIEIQFKVGTPEDVVVNLAQQFEDNNNIGEYKVMSPSDNMQDFKSLMEKDDLFDEFNYQDHIPWSILLRLRDPKLGDAFKAEVMQYPGVYDVMMETALMKTLEQAINSVNIFSVVVFIILLFVTVFVINNMIKMIALSRSNELSIMKTMGATDAYIRIPFIIEGVFVALIASIMAIAIIFIGYAYILNSQTGGFIAESLLPFMGIIFPVILSVLLFSLFVGTLTSALSVKKYIQV